MRRDELIGIGAVACCVVVMMAMCLSLVALPGCITTQSPDGTVTTQIDVAAVQLALTAAQQLYADYQAAHPDEPDTDRAAELQAQVDYWLAVLERAQGGSNASE